MKKFDYKWTDKAAGKIANAGLKVQSSFAACMNAFTSRLSRRQLTVVLCLFCIAWGGLSIYFIGDAVLCDEVKIKPYKVDAIKQPAVIDQTKEEWAGPMVDESTYRQIQEFKRSGLYDSTINVRPGLKDSIVMLEQIYNSQTK